MARTYHRDSKGRFAKRSGGSSGTSSGGTTRRSSGAGASSRKASRSSVTSVQKTSPATGFKIQNISTGGTISRDEAARVMFGSAGGAKKIAAANRRRRR